MSEPVRCTVTTREYPNGGYLTTVACACGWSEEYPSKALPFGTVVDAAWRGHRGIKPHSEFYGPHRLWSWHKSDEPVAYYYVVCACGDEVAGYNAPSEINVLDTMHRHIQDEEDKMTMEYRSSPNVKRPTTNKGTKAIKPEQLSSLDPKALLAVAKVAGDGAATKGRLNYMGGYDWSLSFDAAQRHMLNFWNGEDLDKESGSPNLAHAAWHMLALLAFMDKGLGTDDRYKD